MQIEMTLNVVVKGADFSELQRGLAEAALGQATSGYLKTTPVVGTTVQSGPMVPTMKVPPQGEHLGKVDPEREQIALEKEKKKWDRKLKPTKAEREAAVSTPVATEDAASEKAPATAPMATRKDAIAALSEVNEAVDYEAAKACLETFKVKRLGELPEEQIDAFIAHCKEKIAAGKTELPAGSGTQDGGEQ